jgi:hypothetical protein
MSSLISMIQDGGARQSLLEISPDWPWKEALLTCWQWLCPCQHPPDQLQRTSRNGRRTIPAQSDRCVPGHEEQHKLPFLQT